MAGVEADLTLDSRQAQAAVAALERQIDAASSIVLRVDTSAVPPAVSAAIAAADSQVVVTGDADALTGEVTSAVDAGDTEVVVTGDASQVTGEVTSAVDAADSNVIVTADASSVTGTVSGAVDAADTNVVVTADASGLAGATGQADALNASLVASTASGINLRSVLATGGTAAAVAGLGALVNAASDLEQAVGGTRAVFGEAEGAVVDFARGAAEAAGLSEEAARRLTSQIGGLLQGFQFTQEEAAATSVQLAQLGADLAATFGGNPEEAVQALGAALRGEFDPLERFGVSLNITQANLRAVELGLADSTSEVSLNARAQASLSLIMERSANAQGQFARESETAAGQLERAKAEAQNAAAAVGAALLPAFVDLLGSLRGSILPTLQELGETLGPALGRILQAAGPLVEGFGAGLQALVPVATALAAVLNAIPAPVLQMVGTFLAFRAAAGPLGPLISAVATQLVNLAVPTGAVSGAFNTAATASQSFGSRIGGMVAAINPATAALAAAAIGFTLYAQQQAEAAADQRAWEAQTNSFREALTSTEGAVEGITDQLADLIKTGGDVEIMLGDIQFSGVEVDKVFASAGVSAQQFAEGLADANQPLDALIEQLAAGNKESQGAAIALNSLTEQYEAAARASLEAGVSTEAWTDAQRDAAIEQTRNEDGSRNYVAALDVLTEAQNAEEEATEAATQALTDQQQAVADLVAQTPALGLYMAALSDGSTRSTASLAGMAVALADAGVSGTDLQAVLAGIGADSSPAAAAALEAIGATITGLRDEALGTLPALQDIAGAADEFTLTGFRDELQNAYDAIVGFNDNLVVIAQQGGPRLAAAAAQLGPEYAQAIADGIASGNPEVVAQTELLLAGIEQAGVNTAGVITSTVGPGLVTATGQMATAATTAWGEGFVLDPSGAIVNATAGITTSGQAMVSATDGLGNAAKESFHASFTPDASTPVSNAISTVSGYTGSMSTAGGAVGTAGAAGFETDFQPNPGPALEQARALVDRGAAAMAQAGFQLGDQAVRGFVNGTQAWGFAAASAAAGAVRGAGAASGTAASVGYSIGAALGAGMADGISDWTGRIQTAAVSAVNQAAAAARRAAQISSPSKVFATIGEQIGEGMAVGIDASASAVAAAAASLTDAAAAAAGAGQVGIGVVGPADAALAAVSAGLAANGSGGGDVIVNVSPGAVVIEGTGRVGEDVASAGRQLATVLGRQLTFTARTGG